MELTLNVFEISSIKAVANILQTLVGNKGLICTVACRGNIYSFRIFKALSPEDIQWTCEGQKDTESSPTTYTDKSISWASESSEAKLLVEIDGENKKTLLKICEPFTVGLQRKEKGIVAYWE